MAIPILSPQPQFSSTRVTACDVCGHTVDLSAGDQASLRTLCHNCWERRGVYTYQIPGFEVICAACQHPPERVTLHVEPTGLLMLEISCHGETQRQLLAPYDLGNPGTRLLKITAFGPIEHASVGLGEAAGSNRQVSNALTLPGTTAVDAPTRRVLPAGGHHLGPNETPYLDVRGSKHRSPSGQKTPDAS